MAITSPKNDRFFSAPSDVVITVAAADNDGSIVLVEYERKLLEAAKTKVVHLCKDGAIGECKEKAPCAAHFRASAVVEHVEDITDEDDEGDETDGKTRFQLEDHIHEGHVCVFLRLYLAGM